MFLCVGLCVILKTDVCSPAGKTTISDQQESSGISVIVFSDGLLHIVSGDTQRTPEKTPFYRSPRYMRRPGGKICMLNADG